MRYIADLHLHSKYSRACSKDLDLEHNDQWARIKGIQIVGTGDFTHPRWVQELKEKLVEEKPGLFKLRGTDATVLFMLTTELSCIYSQGGKVRRVHLCIFAPDFATVDTIIASLEQRHVNLHSDGRPIMGLSAEELTKIVFDAHPEALVVPAHIWTPWFSVFGSHSGYDSIQDCFGSMAQHIYALETGLSSDPAMNWRLSALDPYLLMSNSDAHSSANLGREANAFDIPSAELSYAELRRIIKEKDRTRFLFTIEFFPEEGKYHWDGHRACNVRLEPAETKKNKGICPKCKKPLTIGVDYRVDELADRPVGYTGSGIPFKRIVPLPEIIAEVVGQRVKTKKVDEMYQRVISGGGSEFEILLDHSPEQLTTFADPVLVQAIMNVREGVVQVDPGYDGVYGVISALAKQPAARPRQNSLL